MLFCFQIKAFRKHRALSCVMTQQWLAAFVAPFIIPKHFQNLEVLTNSGSGNTISDNFHRQEIFFLVQFFSDQLKKLEVVINFIKRSYSKSLYCNYFVALSRLITKAKFVPRYLSYTDFKLLCEEQVKTGGAGFF